MSEAAKDAEIERLNKLYRAALEELVNQEQLIMELADAMEKEVGESLDLMQSQQHPWSLIRQAREASKDE